MNRRRAVTMALGYRSAISLIRCNNTLPESAEVRLRQRVKALILGNNKLLIDVSQ